MKRKLQRGKLNMRSKWMHTTKTWYALSLMSHIQTLTWLALIFFQWGQEEGSDESEKSRSEVNDEDEASGEVIIPTKQCRVSLYSVFLHYFSLLVSVF